MTKTTPKNVRNWSQIDVLNILMNPFYAINIDPSFCIKHKPIISKEIFISAFCNFIEKENIKLETALSMMLDILEGKYITDIEKE